MAHFRLRESYLFKQVHENACTNNAYLIVLYFSYMKAGVFFCLQYLMSLNLLLLLINDGNFFFKENDDYMCNYCIVDKIETDLKAIDLELN